MPNDITKKKTQLDASLKTLRKGRSIKATYIFLPYSLKPNPEERNIELNAIKTKNNVILCFLDNIKLANPIITGKKDNITSKGSVE